MSASVRHFFRHVLLLLAGVATCEVADGYASVVINEFMAANSKTIQDPQGQYDDWIELYNSGDSVVDVGGMYLTDDLTDPRKWQIPTGGSAETHIAARGYLLIWADGDTGDNGLHADFRLSAGGEAVGLFASDGSTLVDSVVFGRQLSDVSYGRYPNGGGSWVYMDVPTPNGDNSSGYHDAAANVEFSHARGFYDTAFTLRLATKAGDALIYYTLDGNDPVNQSGEGIGLLYTGAIPINTTTCVRAAAVKAGAIAPRICTATYLFLNDVIHQPVAPTGFPSTWGSRTADYAMDPTVVSDPAYRDEIKDDLKSIPTVSIVIPVADFFGSAGIYANSIMDGDNWERAASMEWIDPCTGDQFGVNAGLRISGGYYARSNWVNRKFGLQFFFRSEYGMSRLEFPMFKDAPVTTFSRLGLREIWNYSWIGDGGNVGSSGYGADYLRDLFARNTVRDMARLTSHGRPVHLYIDGLYWGLYILTEKIDDDFAADYLGGSKDDYDILEAPSTGSSTMKVLTGDKVTIPPEWNTLYTKASEDVTSLEAYQDIQRFVDPCVMIDYMLMIYYTGSRDAPTFLGLDANPLPHNFFALRSRTPAGPFLFLPWDTEWCLESPTENRLNVWGVYNPSLLMNQMVDNVDFLMSLADRVHKQFHNSGPLTRDSVVRRYAALSNEIRGAIVGESARWGDLKRMPAFTRVDWQREVDRLNNTYFSGRTETVFQQLRSRGWYPPVEAPSFQINGKPQFGGSAPVGASLAMTNPNGEGTIYYTLDGTDPRLPGSGSGEIEAVLVAEDAAKKVLVPAGSVSDAWQGGADFDDSAWISGSGGVGYEVSTGYESYFGIDLRSQMYYGNTSCYIRVPFPVTEDDIGTFSDLTLSVRVDDGFIAYINGVEVARKNFTGTPVWNSAAGDVTDDGQAVILTPWTITEHIGSLRAGQNILAVQGLNRTNDSSDLLISVELTAKRGIGTAGGVSPTAIKYDAPATLSTSVVAKARVLSSGTWSALNEAIYTVGPVAQSLRISEIMYHPLDPNTEYVELTNVGPVKINLNLVKFTKGIDFVFPSVDLAPHAYVLVVQDRVAFAKRYEMRSPEDFLIAGRYKGSLSNAGERVRLEDAAGTVIEDFSYNDKWYDLTDGMGFSLTVNTAALVDANSVSDKSAWRPSAWNDGSPGRDDSSLVPEPGAVVVNELMANPGPGLPGWIELHNTTSRTIPLGGWFLSDDSNNLTKYQIAADTNIPAGGYLVLREDTHFGNPSDPGCRVPFAFSRTGETAFLHSALAGELGGYTQQEEFGATETGVSLGRYEKSTGSYNFVELTGPTPGAANVAPKVGPIVISEILYSPSNPPDSQYVELLNISDTDVTLYDPNSGMPWRFTVGDPENPTVELLLPSDAPITLEPGQYVILAKSLDGFKEQFSIPAGVPIVAWGIGWLSKDGDKVQISKPADPNGHWIRVDRVVYSDGSHPDFGQTVDPWPAGADGGGQSLNRIVPVDYGNDPANWRAATPTPGRGSGLIDPR